MNLFRRLMVWWKLRELQATDDIQKLIKKGLERVKKEETEACEHKRLRKVIPEDIWYRCTKCQRIFMIPLEISWEKKNLGMLLSKLQEELKLKDKDES